MEHPEPDRLGRRPAYVKWWIFGVLLPLLPLGARVLAAWFDNAAKSLSFTTLLSDGELLVIATVISAAIIGDLLFDFSGRNEVRTRTTIAVLCAFSLLVVVVSVLMFGLVTLDDQNRSDALQQTQRTVAGQVAQSIQLAAQSNQAQTQSNFLSQQIIRLNNELATSPRNVVLVRQLRDQATIFEQQSAVYRAESTSLSHRSIAIRSSADQLLERNVTNLAIGRQQAAVMSLIMFVIAVLTGIAALWFSTARDEVRPDREATRPGHNAGLGQQLDPIPSKPPAEYATEHIGEAARPRHDSEPRQ